MKSSLLSRVVPTLAAAAAAAALLAAPAHASTPADQTRQACADNKTARGCVEVRWTGRTGKVHAAAVSVGKGGSGGLQEGAVTKLYLQRRACGGSWTTIAYNADPDGYAWLDTASTASYASNLRGHQWRASATVSWRVKGYPSTRGSAVRTTAVLGRC